MEFWSREQLAIEICGPRGNSQVIIPRPFALVGALARADVRLDGEGVEKRAVFLHVSAGKVTCRRLEAPLQEAYRELQPDDWLELGAHRLRVRVIVERGLMEAESALSVLESKPRIPVLRVRHRGHPSVNRRLYDPLELVGRHPDCEFELHSIQVSLYHCVLFRESDRLWCIDLGSGNGTFLNAERIGCALVELGARLKVGSFELQFQRFSRRSTRPDSGSATDGSHIVRDGAETDEDEPHQGSTMGSGMGLLTDAVDTLFSGASSGPSALTMAAAPAARLPPEELRLLEEQRAELAHLQLGLRQGLDSMAAENAGLRSDWDALSQKLCQQIDQHRQALVEDIAQQTRRQQALALDVLRLEEMQQSAAPTGQTAEERQLHSQEFLQRLEQLQAAQAQELKQRSEELRRTLSEEFLQQLEQQRAALSQELQSRLQEHSSHLAAEQRAPSMLLSERLQSLLQTLERIASEQSRLSTGLAEHARQIHVIRQGLADLQTRDSAAGSSSPATAARETWESGFIDAHSETSAELPAHEPDTVESIADSASTTVLSVMQEAPEPWSPIVSEAVVERRVRQQSADDDRLQHFVSDRLVELDSGRQQKLIVYWAVAITIAGVICVLAWALRAWLPAAT